MATFPKELSAKLAFRKENNAFRTLQTHNRAIDFVSNDYLGFAGQKTIHTQAIKQIEKLRHCNGSTGSRLISGTHPLHEQVESELAQFHNADAALLFNSGYDANVGLFSSVLQKGATVLYDELIHASIRDGIRLSNAKSLKFKHNDLSDLAKKYSKCTGTVYIAVESVYSMDGDTAPLQELTAFSQANNCFLIVDEAHSNGVFGEKGAGLVQELQLEKAVFARVHTFGKALGCHGAVVLGSQTLRDYLINFSRSFIYTTAASLHSIAVIQAAYEELQSTTTIEKLHGNIAFFRQLVSKKQLGSHFIESNSPIQCCLIPGNSKAKEAAEHLQSKGFATKAVLAPTVPQGQERLRICLHSYNTFEQIETLLTQLATFVAV